MPWRDVIWTFGPDGNAGHIAEHGITVEEVEQVLSNPDEVVASRTSGRPVAFGYTRASRYIAVVFEEIDDVTVYPITAYEVSP